MRISLGRSEGDERLRKAYQAGAVDALLAAQGGPKPDADRYLKKLRAQPTIALFG